VDSTLVDLFEAPEYDPGASIKKGSRRITLKLK
jgi:hypothetical protein